jgi:hypothetical protein
MNFFLTRNFSFFTILFLLCLQLVSCDQDVVIAKNNITPEDDAKIGSTIDIALLNYIDTSSGITLLDQQSYPGVYSYVNQVSQFINGSNSFLTLGTDLQGNLLNDNYTPTIRVIDQVGNSGAFVLPGGYIYLYKDLLKKINFEAQFAPILAHLMACSKNRYDVEKLETRFSTNFLLALALGGTINNNSETNIATILDALDNDPYPTNVVDMLDKEAEKAVCELGYDVQTYADWFIQQSNGNVKWCHQFPRSLSLADYASHLFYAVKDSLSCGGEVDEGGYPQFKSLLN